MFRDRIAGGIQLLSHLHEYRNEDAVVLGLPRGGVPVAAVIAEGLDAPLDVIVVRKLGLPFQPEVAMGAVAEGDTEVLHSQLITQAGVSSAQLTEIERRERNTLDRRVDLLRRGSAPESLEGRTAIVVDDGLATGATAEAACRAARSRRARRVVVAAPVGPRDAARRVPSADEVICAEVPDRFHAVGQAYAEFEPTSDEEVVLLLDDARRRKRGESWRPMATITSTEVTVTTDDVSPRATLGWPSDPTGFVVFAHGSGSSRRSPRNRVVADALNRAGLGTLLLDLLSPAEESDRSNVFDIPLLGTRLVAAVEWLRGESVAAGLPIGYFGASTGAGAALWAAADPRSGIVAVVSRGGRPDLAGDRLRRVAAPVMLIVGGADSTVLELNRHAQAQLGGPSRLIVIPGATHLFEESGALAEVAIVARRWFLDHFVPADADPPIGGAP
ncbi:phosphoribosyltransferase family protein [Agromyces sp. NPDC055520]